MREFYIKLDGGRVKSIYNYGFSIPEDRQELLLYLLLLKLD